MQEIFQNTMISRAFEIPLPMDPAGSKNYILLCNILQQRLSIYCFFIKHLIQL